MCSKCVIPNPQIFVHVPTSIYIKLRIGYYWWLQLESITVSSLWLLLHVCKLIPQQRRTWLLPSVIHLLNCPIPVYTMNCFKIIPAVTLIQFSDPEDIHLVVARVESLAACFPSFLSSSIYPYSPTYHTCIHLHLICISSEYISRAKGHVGTCTPELLVIDFSRWTRMFHYGKLLTKIPSWLSISISPE